MKSMRTQFSVDTHAILLYESLPNKIMLFFSVNTVSICLNWLLFFFGCKLEKSNGTFADEIMNCTCDINVKSACCNCSCECRKGALYRNIQRLAKLGPTVERLDYNYLEHKRRVIYLR